MNHKARVHQAARSAAKGTIEEVLGGEPPIDTSRAERFVGPEGPKVIAVAQAREDRGDSDTLVTPPARLAPLLCPICEGKGVLEATPEGRVRACGRCGGEGCIPQTPPRQQSREILQASTQARVEDLTARPLEETDDEIAQARADLRSREDDEARAEAALAREAAGQQASSFEEEARVNACLLVEGSPRGPRDRAPASDDADPPAQPVVAGEVVDRPTLTYDLPTAFQALPLFCFVCGPAGTGKTFWAKALAAAAPEAVVLAATTGIAAVNLGEGTTINALLKYYDTASLLEAYTGGWLEGQLVRLRRAGLQRIVLDEVSMLDGDQLTILTRALDNVNAQRGGDDPEVGLLLVGDFAQLPPVKAPFAFESAEWERFAQATYGLTTIRRQADQPFVEALQAVRRGDASTALEFFGPRLESTTHAHFAGTTILAKNAAVEKYNQLRLDKVPGKALRFASSRWGRLRPEWGGEPYPTAKWGVPEVLQLKEGALVMILANRNVALPPSAPAYLYVNGDLGEVVGAEHGAATVVLQRTGEPVQVGPITRENLIPLEPGRRKALRAEGHPERISQSGKHEVIGAVTYLPLRLAYASTVHKSQGLSLSAVQVNIRDHFFSTAGMLYVSLSRARTAEGLRIVGTPEGFRARCTTSPKVLPWL